MPQYPERVIYRKLWSTLVMFGLCGLTLSGCATMGQLDAPPDWCSAPGKTIAAEKEGDDAVQKLAETKQELAREKSKRRCLQKYSKAVSG